MIRRVSRIYLPLEVDFADDSDIAKLARFGAGARGCRDLLVQMWCYCKREASDGHVPAEQVGKLVYPDAPKNGVRDADRLVEVGLAERTETGYYFPKWLQRHKSKAQIAEESARKAAIGAKGGKVSGQVRAAEANAKHGASQVANTELREQSSEFREDQGFGGVRPETLHAVPDSTPPIKPTCIKHPDGNPTNEKCGGCAKIRERSEAVEARDLEKTRKAAEKAARECPRCEGTGKMLTEDKIATGRRCWPHVVVGSPAVGAK